MKEEANYDSVYFDIYIFKEKESTQNVLERMVAGFPTSNSEL
jgi:hypothetical protein